MEGPALCLPRALTDLAPTRERIGWQTPPGKDQPCPYSLV
jgi:hypothetical protein